MESEQEQVFLNCCRICLLDKEITVNVFDGVEGFDGSLSDMIEKCGDVKIDTSDEHSKIICEICIQELLIAVKFKEKCKKSEEILASVSLKLILEYENDQSNQSEDNIKENFAEENEIENDAHSIVESDIKDEQVEYDNMNNSLNETVGFATFEDCVKSGNIKIENPDQNNIIENLTENEEMESSTFEDIEYLEVENDVEYLVVNSSNDATKYIEMTNEDNKADYMQEEIVRFPRKWKKKKSDLSYSVSSSMSARINHSCEICGAGFTHLMNLQRHLVTVHQLEISDISTCPICSLTFLSTEEFQVHIKLHQSDDETNKNLELLLKIDDKLKKPFLCTTCNKRFVSKSTLKSHERIHTGEKPFSCLICTKSFGTIGGLDLHQRRHSGYKPYKCEYCDRGFVETSNLKVHMRTHTGEKPHVCTMCGKGFSRVFLLQLHLRTHTGEKPYSCTICWKAFAQQSDLAAHKRIHTGERPHKCNICNKGFIKSSGLHSHMRRHEKSGNSKLREITNSFEDSIQEEEENKLEGDFVDDDVGDSQLVSLITFSDLKE